MSVMLSAEGLKSGYGMSQVVTGVSLDLKQGQILSIIGPNGAGKTTLIKTLSGLVKTNRGSIILDGKDITTFSAYQRSCLGMAHIPEGRSVFVSMTVKENLLVGAYPRMKRGERADISKELEYIYELFPRLKERKNNSGGSLSGGEQQMLAIGRALMAKPKILMLDEPSLGLVPSIVKDILRILTTLKDEGKAILIVEQNARSVLGISDYAYVMRLGKFEKEGTGRELLEDEQLFKSYLGVGDL